MPMFEILSALKTGTAELSDSASPRLDVEILLMHILQLQRTDLYRYRDRVLTDEEVRAFQEAIHRRKAEEPIAYITGQKEFWSLPFAVNRHVLIPRPDTEILVEEAIRIGGQYGSRTLLEIGTGSGAIGVALASTLQDIAVTATDLSEEALEVARHNAVTNRVADRIRFLQGNLFEPVEGCFDIIVSNPPYIPERDYALLPEGVRCFEPQGALIAGTEGTEFHRLLITQGRKHLTTGGWLLMEFGVGQGSRILEMFREAQFADGKLIKDLGGFDRVALARKD